MSGRCIPFFNYPALFERDRERTLPVIEDVLARGAYIMQRDLGSFEESLGKYLGVKHVIGVADGTIALIMGLRAAGIGTGDEVIVPSHTFVASAAAIHHAGAVPVLADCASDHLIDADDVRRKVNSRTRAIMPVQLNGRTADMGAIQSVAKEFGLAIVEDSAQALGSKFEGRFAGTFGAAGTCSFYPSKTLGCFGDGGAVLTDSDEIAAAVRLYRDHGRDPVTGDVITWGYNSRLDNLQAAVLGLKLKSYPNEIARRREIAKRYNDGLQGVGDLVLPPGPDADPRHFDIYQNYEIETDFRDGLREYLDANGVKTIIQWGGKTLHQFPKLNLRGDVPFTERMTKRFMLLPMNTSLADDDVDYIVETIRRFPWGAK